MKNKKYSIEISLIIALIISIIIAAVSGYMQFVQHTNIAIVFYFSCGFCALCLYGLIDAIIKNIKAKATLTKGVKGRATFVKAQIISRTYVNNNPIFEKDKYSVILRFTNEHGVSKEKKVSGFFTLPMVQYFKEQGTLDVYLYKNNCTLDEKYFDMNIDNLPLKNPQYNDVNGTKTIKQEVPKTIYDQVIDGGTIPIRIYKDKANIDIQSFNK